MNRTSRQDWTAWGVGADDEIKTAVRQVWAVLGPVDLITDDPTPSCVVCGGHDWLRYGDGGSPVCPACREVAA
jgi:hypothetical protein